MLITCEKINSSGSIESNFPRFTDQFSLRCEINSTRIKLLCAKLLLAFEILSPLAERVQSEKREYRELFTRNGESDTLGLVLSYRRSAPFDCVT